LTLPLREGVYYIDKVAQPDFERLCAHLRAHGAETDAAHPCLALYYDQEYRERDVDKEKTKMQPMIVTKPAFSAIGLKYRGKNENSEIAAMWGTANARVEEIVAAATGIGAAYGICRDMESDGVFEYLACMEVEEIREIPEGMERWDVPEQTYAVFPCKLATIGEAYRYAFEEWLPASGYRRGDSPDFEYYDESFDPNDAENSQLYIYIPIVK